jgi:hypothetical protein
VRVDVLSVPESWLKYSSNRGWEYSMLGILSLDQLMIAT